jgi:RNA polymerase sigma-70 factor (ECF subfamily)
MPIAALTAPEEARLLDELLSARTGRERERTWSVFVERFRRLIGSCVRGALVRYGAPARPDDIDDLVGEVWIALLDDDLRRLRAFSPDRGARLSTFIGLLATNHTIDRLRRRRIDATSLDDLATSHRALAVKETTSGELESRQHAVLAQAALCRLSASERSFVAVAFCEERDPAVMARELGVTKTTIYTRKVKVRDKLRRLVGELAA